MIVPVVQSMVADLTDSSNCGSTFGKVSCSCSLGQVLACLMVTPISEQYVFGMRGWRFSLASFGVLSLLTIPFVRMAVDEEPRVWKPRRFGICREVRTIPAAVAAVGGDVRGCSRWHVKDAQSQQRWANVPGCPNWAKHQVFTCPRRLPSCTWPVAVDS
eukprot:symbB.v1.2.005654.t1/scaffold327.1/size259883/7